MLGVKGGMASSLPGVEFKAPPLESSNPHEVWVASLLLMLIGLYMKSILRACYVLGTNISDVILTDLEVTLDTKLKEQWREESVFLKSLPFFASLLFVKKPSRNESLPVMMTLVLLAYSVAQRRFEKTTRKGSGDHFLIR